jgi:hypothetical protein
MSPHNDRCTSPATVPPNPDGPDTAADLLAEAKAPAPKLKLGPIARSPGKPDSRGLLASGSGCLLC